MKYCDFRCDFEKVCKKKMSHKHPNVRPNKIDCRVYVSMF